MIKKDKNNRKHELYIDTFVIRDRNYHKVFKLHDTELKQGMNEFGQLMEEKYQVSINQMLETQKKYKESWNKAHRKE